ncbi:CocE/NonD family hydrolase [Terriglobus aquaticus]|uniref:CocE/NonD family hydrolase n=1 Tax=Terriglobus aquaticus TaxID=940139 RepID=A0ABW9KK29_9BACT|nr:CocE/NonD family hydrolase [Terriglobus aquaticus]
MISLQRSLCRAAVCVATGLALSAVATAQSQAAPQPRVTDNDIPTSFTAPKQQPFVAPAVQYDYDRREVMIPMRDGTKLFAVIVVPKGAKGAPMVLTRTCYNAGARASASRVPTATGSEAAPAPAQAGRNARVAGASGERDASPRPHSPHMVDELPLSDEVFVRAGYIRVYQDVRGKYGSEGKYLMTPPPVGPWNPTGADDTMDAYDTIDWLVKNVPESNGKVGMIGSSYEGFTVVMALLNPHPALKVASPESPMVDGWMGDDWFHYGAFRQRMLDYFIAQTSARGAGSRVQHEQRDDYSSFLSKGSAGDFARAQGQDQLPFWRTVEEHPAYDSFWQSQALDKLIAQKPLTVPTLWLQGLWDQEDMWGAIHSYRAVEPKDTNNDKNYLVMGPWRHSQVNREGRSLGPLIWDGDTTANYRQDVLLPFFNQYLKDGSAKADTPPVYIYNTGEDHWDRFSKWPLSCEAGCEQPTKPLYLHADGTLSFDKQAESRSKFTDYVSDPAKPVPYSPRPVTGSDWGQWLVLDQRFVDGRPDVLTWQTAPLKEAMRVSGEPTANLVASSSGTDSDWVVKIIDVFPDGNQQNLEMNGYELPISMDIFRGRYRKSFEKPEALKPNQPEEFKFGLPQVNHVFQPGHRIMVQVQSTWFPLYDRNPQTFVPNIFDAKAADYQKATQRIYSSSTISMPVVPVQPVTIPATK